MEITFRKASANDSLEIAQLSSQLGYPTKENQIIERLIKILAQEDHIVYVAEYTGKVIGWVHVHARYLIESHPCIEISGLIVDSHFRGQSIGKKLVNYCEDWAISLGFEEIQVRTNEKRLETLKFYDNIGFEHTKSQHVFKKDLIS